MSVATADWASFHLFVAGAEDLDELSVKMAEIVREEIGNSAQWFFIRYNERGPHLRLRVQLDVDRKMAALRRRVSSSCSDISGGRPLSAWAASAGVPDSKGRMATPGEMIEIPYIPETTRYGGEAALHLSERVFCVSSQLAVAVADRSQGERGLTNSFAMSLMLAAIAVCSCWGIDPGRFLVRYAAFWRRAGDQNEAAPFTQRCKVDVQLRLERYQRMARGEIRWAGTVGTWGAALAELLAGAERLHLTGRFVSPASGKLVSDAEGLRLAMEDIVGSHVHMMNNRLGVWPDVETKLADHMVRSMCSPADVGKPVV